MSPQAALNLTIARERGKLRKTWKILLREEKSES